MHRLEKRISQLEGARAIVNLKKMTDEELLAYAGTFPMGSEEMFAAVLALVLRHPSPLPVVHDAPGRAGINAMK